MRVQELAKQLDELIPLVIPVFETHGSGQRVVGIQRAVEAARRIALLPIAQRIRDVANFIASSPASGWLEGATLATDHVSQFTPYMQELQSRLRDLRESLEVMLRVSSAPDISLQLPNVSTVADLASWATQVDRGIVSVFREHFGADVSLQGVDRGSVWLELIVAAAAGSGALGVAAHKLPEIINAFFNGVAKLVEVRTMQRETYAYVDRYEKDTQIRHTIHEAQAKVLTGVAGEVTDELLAMQDPSAVPDKDARLRLLQGIEAVADLVEAGGKIELLLPDRVRDPDGKRGTVEKRTIAAPAAGDPKRLSPGEKK